MSTPLSPSRSPSKDNYSFTKHTPLPKPAGSPPPESALFPRNPLLESQDILPCVLGFLPPKDRAMAERVNKGWHSAAKIAQAHEVDTVTKESCCRKYLEESVPFETVDGKKVFGINRIIKHIHTLEYPLYDDDVNFIIDHFPNLKTLSLRDCFVTLASAKNLFKLQDLETLFLAHNFYQLTYDSLLCICHSLPKLTTLSLAYSQFEIVSPALCQLANLKQLQHLDLKEIDVAPEELEAICSLPHLKSLSFQASDFNLENIQNVFLAGLTQATSLKKLDIVFKLETAEEIPPSALNAILSLPNLESLCVENEASCPLTPFENETFPAFLRNLGQKASFKSLMLLDVAYVYTDEEDVESEQNAIAAFTNMIQAVASMTKLESFYLHVDRPMAPEHWEALSNLSPLTHITIIPPDL